jgi:hypothetical protein
VSLVPVTGLAPDAVDRVRAIYEGGFPPEQRFAFQDVLRDPAYALVEQGEPTGLVVFRPIGTGWVFVRYFVAGVRGRGVGHRLWHASMQLLQARLVVLDLDDPDETGIDAGEHRIRERRIAFYESVGLELLPVRGYYPPHDGPPHPMRLMATAAGVDLRELVTVVYRDRYGLAPDHPTVRRTLYDSGLNDR